MLSFEDISAAAEPEKAAEALLTSSAASSATAEAGAAEAAAAKANAAAQEAIHVSALELLQKMRNGGIWIFQIWTLVNSGTGGMWPLHKAFMFGPWALPSIGLITDVAWIN